MICGHNLQIRCYTLRTHSHRTQHNVDVHAGVAVLTPRAKGIWIHLQFIRNLWHRKQQNKRAGRVWEGTCFFVVVCKMLIMANILFSMQGSSCQMKLSWSFVLNKCSRRISISCCRGFRCDHILVIYEKECTVFEDLKCTKTSTHPKISYKLFTLAKSHGSCVALMC